MWYKVRGQHRKACNFKNCVCGIYLWKTECLFYLFRIRWKEKTASKFQLQEDLGILQIENFIISTVQWKAGIKCWTSGSPPEGQNRLSSLGVWKFWVFNFRSTDIQWVLQIKLDSLTRFTCPEPINTLWLNKLCTFQVRFCYIHWLRVIFMRKHILFEKKSSAGALNRVN